MTTTNAQAALMAASNLELTVEGVEETANLLKGWLDKQDAADRRAAQEKHVNTGAITLPVMPVPGVQD